MKKLVMVLLCIIYASGCSSVQSSIELPESLPTAPVQKPVKEDNVKKNVLVINDFSKRVEPPLHKKFSMFNSGLVPIKNYERDLDKIIALYSDSLRIDLGIGANNFPLKDVVSGTIDNIKYDFVKIDYLAVMLNERRVLPYFSWSYIPTPLQIHGDHRKGPADLDKYREVLSVVAKHYRDEGIRIGYHEIYNEPDLDGIFYSGTFEEYMELYKYGSLGIRDGDPDAVVGGPSFAIPERIDNTSTFLKKVVEDQLPLDFFSYHHYWLNSSFQQKHNIVKNALSKYQEFKTTEIHLNEVAYITGWQPGDDSINNFYGIAPKIFKMMLDILSAPDITVVSWAQFMESTVVGDAYGMIFRDGTKKALYNAFKIYADMPVERTELHTSNPVIDGIASCGDDKAVILLWNTGSESYKLETELKNLPFMPKEVRLYRIDKNNASAFDGGNEELSINEKWSDVKNGKLPDIIIEPGATVYITLVSDRDIVDFDYESKHPDFPPDIRLHYYFEDRYKNNYAFIDRKSWRIDLGMGENVTAYSAAGATFNSLPEILRIRTKTSGHLSFKDNNSYVGIRLDFNNGQEYIYSVAFSPRDFGSRFRNIGWGTKMNVDRIVIVDNFDDFEINLSDYLNSSTINQRVTVTFEMENTGPKTSIVLYLEENW